MIGVVAPAAAIEPEYLQRGVSALVALGFKVKVSKRALDRDGILAGSDRGRAAELTAFFNDPEVGAIFAARSGYGCGRLLPLLDFGALARSRKIFLGYSDATFLLNALVELGPLICFHGPMVAMDFARGLSARSLVHLQRLLAGAGEGFELAGRETIRAGAAEGELIGGCLSIVAAMLATPYAPSFKDRILFIEDTGEKAYRIDRMLVHLRQAGVFEQAAGVVFGGMRAVDGNEDEKRLIARFIAEQTADLRGPVMAGVEAGHGTDHLTLPLGARVALDAGRRRLVFIETPVG